MYKLSKGMLYADGCGAQNTLQRRLYDCPPEVFTLQLAWQTNSAAKHDIKAAMMGLREVRASLAVPGFAVRMAHYMLMHAATMLLSKTCRVT